MTRKLLSLFALALAATGCASPLTIADIEGEQGAQAVVMVDAPPTTVYRRLTERARECLQLAELQVQNDFYADTNSGRVSLYQAATAWTLATAKIEPAPTGTRLSVATWDPGRRRQLHHLGRDFPTWAKGEPGGCALTGK